MSFLFPHCAVWGVVMDYRRDSTEIFQGEMKNIDSPGLFFARSEIQKNVRYREATELCLHTLDTHFLLSLSLFFCLKRVIDTTILFPFRNLSGGKKAHCPLLILFSARDTTLFPVSQV